MQALSASLFGQFSGTLANLIDVNCGLINDERTRVNTMEGANRGTFHASNQWLATGTNVQECQLSLGRLLRHTWQCLFFLLSQCKCKLLCARVVSLNCVWTETDLCLPPGRHDLMVEQCLPNLGPNSVTQGLHLEGLAVQNY